jgi:hypothetical protein
MRRGALNLFHNVLTYSGKNYWLWNYFHWKFIWIIFLKYKKIGCPLGVVKKEFLKLLDLKCERYWILNSFCHWKFNQQEMILQGNISCIGSKDVNRSYNRLLRWLFILKYLKKIFKIFYLKFEKKEI